MEINKRKTWDLSELTNAEGKLEAFLGSWSGILVPPSVTTGFVENLWGEKGKSPEQITWEETLYPDEKIEMVDCIIYPDVNQGERNGKPKIEFPGWHWKKDTTGLLEQLIKLADRKPDRVVGFVKQWGPLWLCEKHHEKLPCFISINRILNCDDSCKWFPAEPLDYFYSEASRIKAAFNIVAALKLGKSVSEEDWYTLGQAKEKNKLLSKEKMMSVVLGTINKMIFGDVCLTLIGTDKPKLTINTGLGFLRIAWLQVAQILANAKGLYICDDCNRPYIRKGRKPAVGRRNYCPECGLNQRGSKKLYAREKAKKIH